MIKITPPKSKYTKLQEIYRQSLSSSRGSILLIDGMNLFLASFNASHMNSPMGEEVGGVYASLRTLMFLANKFSPEYIILCFDGEDGSKFRKSIYSEYKEDRAGIKNSKKIGRFDRQKEAATQLKKFWLYLDNLPVKIIITNGMEADDAIGYIATEQFKDNKKIIISNDKDFFQLVSDKVLVYSNTKKKIYTKEKILEEYHILPENFPLFRAIDGDKSDNIDGIKGVGIKTINKLFPEFSERKITFEEFLIICDEKQGIDKKYQLLLEERDKLLRNYRLMQLQQTSLEAKDKIYIKEKLDDQINIYNFPMIRSFLLQDGFMTEVRKKVFWDNSFMGLNAFAIKHNKKLKGKQNEQKTIT